jgi:hypothetical protein
MPIAKTTKSGSNFTPPGRPGPQKSAEYTDALSTLSEATMSEACGLLLSEKDYEDGKTGEQVGSDQAKLAELLGKCQSANRLIQRHAASVPAMPVQPQHRPPPPAVRGQAKPLKPLQGGKTMLPPRRSAMMARSRTTGNPAKQLPVRSDRSMLQRETSESSIASTASTGSAKSAKKPRLSPPNGEGSAQAPPPSALNFLKALNKAEASKDGKVRTGKKRTSPPLPDETPEPSKRQQPPRTSRR